MRRAATQRYRPGRSSAGEVEAFDLVPSSGADPAAYQPQDRNPAVFEKLAGCPGSVVLTVASALGYRMNQMACNLSSGGGNLELRDNRSADIHYVGTTGVKRTTRGRIRRARDITC